MSNDIDPLASIDPDNNLEISVDACRYFTIEEYNITIGDDEGKYRLLNQNIQCYSAKNNIFEAFLASINAPFHSIVLTETWLEHNFLETCKIDGFEPVHTHRIRDVARNPQGVLGGGVSIFVNSSIYGINKIDELSCCNDTIEICAAKVFRLDKTNVEHYIIGLYRPHTDTEDNFIRELYDRLSNVMLYNKTIIIAGDMNIDLMKLNDAHVNNYLCMLRSLNFIQIINKPTRFPNGRNSSYNPSCLDHIFINRPSQFLGPIFFVDISDHCGSAMHVELDNIPLSIDKKHKITFRLHNEATLSNFEAKIEQTNWNFIANIEDVNDQFLAFQEFLNSMYQDCFPLKTKYIGNKRKNKPWITESTMDNIKMKSYYYKLFKNGIISREENNRLKID